MRGVRGRGGEKGVSGDARGVRGRVERVYWEGGLLACTTSVC